MATWSPSPAARAAPDREPPLTVGLEEELLLLDPETGELAPVASEALDRLKGDPRYAAELPAGQLEVRLPPAWSVPQAVDALRAARTHLVERLAGLARPAAAAVHPCAPAEGPLNRSPRYDALQREFGPLATRQQVCALQVHVAVGGPERTIAVHDALRNHLPEIAALAANAPIYEGRDTGLASIRPVVCGMLPRQGVPPPLGSPVAHAEELAWGARTGSLPDPTLWWWELRPHPLHGTLELRVPDAQTTIGQAAAIVAVTHALVATLCERLERDGALPVAPTWRIEQNRWAACRDGLGATLADLGTGEPVPAAARLRRLLDELEPAATRLGCRAELAAAHALVASGGGAAAQRRHAERHGTSTVPAWLAARFLDESV